MIKHLLNTEEVGYYAAAVRVSEAWYFVPVAIASSLFPALVSVRSVNIGEYENRLQHLFDFMVIIALIVALAISLTADWLVNIIYGSAYQKAATVLTIHIWAGIFVGLGVVRGKWLVTEGLQHLAPLYLGAGAVLNIVLNYIFIPRYGINAAAYTTLVTQAFASYIVPALFSQTRISFYMMTKSLLLWPAVRKLYKGLRVL
jgi:O-antigen/teichoic acid export membrane protein